MKISFHCAGCGKLIQAPAKMLGKTAPCPKCHTAIQVPRFSAEPESRIVKAHHTCPSCGKVIVVSRQHAGQRVRCPCSAEFLVRDDLSSLFPLDTPSTDEGSFPEGTAVPEDFFRAPSERESVSGQSGGNLDEPILIPIDDEPVLIPIESDEKSVVQKRKRSSYATPSFFVSLFLGILTIAICLGAVFLPWTSIAQPLGNSAARNLGSALFGDQAKQMMNETLGPDLVLPQFWLIPLLVIPGVVAAVAMPRPLMRGIVFYLAVLSASIATILATGWLQHLFHEWSPLARFIGTPNTFAVQQSSEPEFGLGLWLMCGVIATLLVATIVNLARNTEGVLVIAGSTILVGLLGYGYLAKWLPLDEVRVELTSAVKRPTVRDVGFGNVASEVEVVVKLANSCKHALIVVADNVGQGRGSSKTWYSKWGQPDIVFHLDRKTNTPANSSKPMPSFSFPGHDILGCVLKPGDLTEVVVHFSPVWKKSPDDQPTLAGEWLLSVVLIEKGDSIVLKKMPLMIPAIEHPRQRQLAQLSDKLRTSENTLKQCLKQISDAARLNATSLSPAELADQLKRAIEAIDAAQAAMKALERERGTVPSTTKTSIDTLAEKFRPPATRIIDLLAKLDQGDVAGAVEQSLALYELKTAMGAPAREVTNLLPLMFLREVRNLIAGEDYQGALRVLVTLDVSQLPDKKRAELPAMVAQTMIRWRQATNPVLVQPDGTLLSKEILKGLDKGTRVAVYGTSETRNLLDMALEKCAPYTPSSEDAKQLAYIRLIAQQLTGKLTRQDVEQYTVEHSGSGNTDLLAWCGLKSLEMNDLPAATKWFDSITQTAPDGPYNALARLGIGVVQLKHSDRELLSTLLLERELLQAKALRTRWSQDTERVLPNNMLCSNLTELLWLEDVALVRTTTDYNDWKNGKKRIPWIRFSGEMIPAEIVNDMRKASAQGNVVFAGSQLFQMISHLRFSDPEKKPINGTCNAVTTWRGRPLNFPFMPSPTDRIPFRSVLFSVKGFEKDSHLVPLLAVSNQEMVSAMWLLPRGGGAVVLLPDSMEATKEALHFVAELVRYSKTATQNLKESP